MRRLFPALWLSLCAFAPLGCVVRAAPGPAWRLEDWNGRHPEAARELCGWVSQHPDAARRLFDWDGHHPDRAHEFVAWAISNPGQYTDAFVATHPNWSGFDWIAVTHRPAINSFLDMCRRHPGAFEELMNYPGALQWAGRHLAC